MNIITIIKDLLRKLKVNRAVFYSIMTTGWAAFAGPLVMLVIAYMLSAEEQGFYYTFNSVLALQVFVELGLATVIVQVTSHEWAFLKRDENDKINGKSSALSRLGSLLRFSFKWYFVCGLVVMVVLSIGGYYFFLTKPYPEVSWRVAWFALCFVAGLTLMMSPFFSIIEGCNYVASIHSFRFVRAVLSSFVLIVSVFFGFGLYALVVTALVKLISSVIYIWWKHYKFIYQLMVCKITEQIFWLKEVWPFQWRIGLSWISGYIIFSILTPVMFYFHGPKVAGQMGMTWAIVSMIESVSFSWMNTRMPQFGILIAQKKYAELDRLFSQLFRITVGFVVLGALCVWLLIYGLQISGLEIGDRLLPILPVTLLLIHRILNVMINNMALYLRAHKREPMLIPSVIGAILVGTSTFLLGSTYGPTGAVGGLLVVTIVWGIPSSYVVFSICRKKWHN
ncbi:MAG: hypothetical protein HQ557_01560 [Bacteroidetes bacterium]|nr:hypothetical protein [Bacteroidota bacterium]